MNAEASQRRCRRVELTTQAFAIQNKAQGQAIFIQVSNFVFF